MAFLLLSAAISSAQNVSEIRINQLGYLPDGIKTAVYISENPDMPQEFALIDALSGDTVLVSRTGRPESGYGKMEAVCRLDFSGFRKCGAYRLAAGRASSPVFPIDPCVYDGTADFILRYMRQQRCGFNPFLRDSCHTRDGYIVWSGDEKRDSTRIDVTGGWHDAGDCLRYSATSAHAVYLMMQAFLRNPGIFGDYVNANGLPGANGIPDIVDEIKWGLDWLVKMNPRDGEMYNQVADDRDHIGMRLPHDDEADYGWGAGNGRPVYAATGKPQCRGRHGRMNDTEGVASTAGKFASDFALGSKIMEPFYPDFADSLRHKAIAAYEMGRKMPGACQTASVLSPYIYEETDWADDMELAAAELYRMTGKPGYMKQAEEYGRMEPVSPWMGADTARHYQWFPFINFGHAVLGVTFGIGEFKGYMKEGLSEIAVKSENDAFRHGIPYIWCSNNLSAAALDQMVLCDDKVQAASFMDWLFGCNPWGTSMIVGLPQSGDFPSQPHSSLLFCGAGRPDGGLVDGPVYSTIFHSLRGVRTEGGEDYAEYQPDRMVYHDSMHDYSTNEPTLDGSAALFPALAEFQNEGLKEQKGRFSHDGNPFFDGRGRNVIEKGGIVRTDTSKKHITLIFTAADKRDGEKAILGTLKKEGIRGYFFFTGEFYEKFPDTVERLLKAGHYIGSHSYGHLLYMPWGKRDSMLVTKEEFANDIVKSYGLIRKAGIRDSMRLFVPPYEYYNETVSSWAKQYSLHLINYTPGSGTNADYTTPDMKGYRSSRSIYEHVMNMEREHGLNGYILLVHFGTETTRTDKFYDKYLDKLIRELKKRGYTF
ncbi:MAG: glycoside hydrolase family 9 protein [Bacteroidales bacterium]|nr:glycoside hydrolase family 9 protein [Bacteroidales bacterium]MCI2122461.1 glycoside hydrolase family 9 protein [Bacteroidales bacterium]MCI2145449.1 glycoside hydrolase family 9 protein [Bacteroidales bacterium]